MGSAEVTPTPRQFNGDFRTDFLSVDQLTLEDLDTIHREADIMRALAQHRGEVSLLQGHVYDLVFWESPSTRTKESFKHAIIRLGGKFVDFHLESSSKEKGETFEDTITMLDSYLVAERDGFIIRNKEEGKLAAAAGIADAIVINAGDGSGEHPTQALLDTKTIRERFPSLEEIHVVFFGDIKGGRTVHSTAPLLAKMGVKRMTFAAPHEELRPDPHMIKALGEADVEVTETDDLREVAQDADVIYAVRTQYERWEDQAVARAKFTGKCLIMPEMIKGSRALVMHPLPEDKEDINFHPELRKLPGYIVNEQAANGQWTRMALLGLQAGKTATRLAELYGIKLKLLVTQNGNGCAVTV